MTNAELDALWFQAQRDAIKAGEDFTRYRFATLIAAAERQRCARIARQFDVDHPNTNYGGYIARLIEETAP
jgi:hypothetical protein